ncbi:hypothetical protein Q8791_23475 [Nocardiopsis sp. CT-R113]|uniref:Uncharacterized protein n=1 Tax=Nocardiopsis codii TaxID=3065942 RepID=A0ABU7KF13_9ACTN|nr:hypothetical protein [Nocardiopsis sp. CT-R113]MEE2040182.1 hypothetical protein [Nocardiopsis sp. CT-R113]
MDPSDWPPLATLDDWPRFTEARQPDHAEHLLAAAGRNIQDWCGWPITRYTAVGEEYDGRGGRVLTLHTMRLHEVAEVRVDGAPVQFRVSRRYGQLERVGGCWPVGFGRIEVDYTAGFDPAPPNLTQLCVEVAARGSNIPVSVSSETVDRRTVRFRAAVELSEFDYSALSRYHLGPKP